MPARALTYAMPAPIIPAPSTATFVDGPRLVPGGTRAACVDRVQVEPERLDHVLRDLPPGEVDEVASLDRERRVDVDGRALDGRAHDVVRRGHRSALELLAQVRGEGRQHAGDLGAARRAAGHPVALGVPRLDGLGVGLDPGACLRRASRPGWRRVRRRCQARPPRLACIGCLAAAPSSARPQAEQADDAGDSAAAGQQAEGDLGQAELRLRVVQCDAVVAGERDLEAAAQSRAVERRDDRLAERLETTQVGLDRSDTGAGTRPRSRRSPARAA